MDKSHYVNMKTQTKTTNGKTKEEEELEKLKDIINKVKNYSNNDYRESLHQTRMNSNRKSRSIHYTTKSNFQAKSNSKTREDRNDREFLSNFMNDEDYISIGAHNMHLLTDDDTNQSITARDKFKKLAKLMLDDKEIVVENGFGQEEEKMILHLYTALSRKSKKVFIEDDPEKLSRLQVFFRRINGIKIPNVPDPNTDQQAEEKKSVTTEKESKGGEASEKESFDDDKQKAQKRREERIKKKLTAKQSFESEETQELPSILKEEEIASFINNENLPKVTCELLSHINHNFITVEQIYNNEQIRSNYNKEEDINIVPVKGVEVIPITEIEQNNLIEGELNDESIEKAKQEKGISKNRFMEFNANCPQTPYDIAPDEPAMKMMKKCERKQQKNMEKISNMKDFDVEFFPENCDLWDVEYIYEVALRNKNMVKKHTDSFSIPEPTSAQETINENPENSLMGEVGFHSSEEASPVVKDGQVQDQIQSQSQSLNQSQSQDHFSEAPSLSPDVGLGPN